MHSHSTSVSHHALIILSSIKKGKRKRQVKSSHKRNIHKDFSANAKLASAEPHNDSQGSNKLIQRGKYVHSHNKTLSKRSQSTLGQFPQRHSRKNTSQDFDRKQAERIQGRIGVGLGLGASALFTTNTQDHDTKKQKTSQVTKDARTKTLPQRHLRKWQALAPQSHTVARKGQINLSKKGKTCTATTRRSRRALVILSSTSRRLLVGQVNRKAPPMSSQKLPKMEGQTDKQSQRDPPNKK